MAIMTWGNYETIGETLDIFSNEEAVDLLRRIAQGIREDETIPWENAKTSL